MLRLREYRYEDGTFSYAQRIAVGDILRDESLTMYQRLKACWRELYGWTARLMPPPMRVRRLDRMVDGLTYWAELECRTLDYKATPEEERAGLARLSGEVGHMGTVKALAQKFGRDPDEVLRWEWGKVYGILYADLKESEYQRRLSDLMSKRNG